MLLIVSLIPASLAQGIVMLGHGMHHGQQIAQHVLRHILGHDGIGAEHRDSLRIARFAGNMGHGACGMGQQLQPGSMSQHLRIHLRRAPMGDKDVRIRKGSGQFLPGHGAIMRIQLHLPHFPQLRKNFFRKIAGKKCVLCGSDKKLHGFPPDYPHAEFDCILASAFGCFARF